MSRRAWLSSATLLLLIYFAARLAALTAFPPFGDESTHIDYGRTVLESGPLARSEEGRQFLVWWYIAFGAQTNASLFIARAANLIVLLPGLAAVAGAARLLSNRWGALFALLLILFSPYHHFFERLALADPPSAAAVALAVYFAARLRRRAWWGDAALCGITLFVACGVKVSALPYFAIPVIAVLTLRRSRAGLRWGAVALLVGGGLTALFFGMMYWRGYNPFSHLATPANLERIAVLGTNISRTMQTLTGYFGVPATILLLIAVVVLLLRRRFFLPLCLLLPLAVFSLNPSEDSRHLIAPVTLLLLCGAVVLGDLVARRSALRLPVLAAVTIWGLALWLPFAAAEIRDPAALPLPDSDRAEYVTSEGSGFGLAEVVAALGERHPARVIGVLANCSSLHDMAPFPVECPRLNPTGEDVPALNALLESARAAGTYAVLEAIPYAPASSPGALVDVIDVGRPRLSIYDLAP